MQVVLEAEIGSTAYGLNTPTSDHDFMGVYLETAESLLGIAPEAKSMRDRPRDEGEKSQTDDEERTIYPLRKYVAMAASGSPTMFAMLHSANVTVPDKIGLRENRDMFLSKQIIARHIGYADGITCQLSGESRPRTNRPELIDAHGWDTKSGMHVLRTTMCGLELVTDGTMTMPMRADHQEYLLSVRGGDVPKDEVLAHVGQLRDQLSVLEGFCPLPERPDYTRINTWLIDVYHDFVL